MVVLDRFFFLLWGQKVIAGHARQVVVLFRSDCMDISGEK